MGQGSPSVPVTEKPQIPAPPIYLRKAARAIWAELWTSAADESIARLRETDAGIVARYCVLLSQLETMLGKGLAPTYSSMSTTGARVIKVNPAWAAMLQLQQQVTALENLLGHARVQAWQLNPPNGPGAGSDGSLHGVFEQDFIDFGEPRSDVHDLTAQQGFTLCVGLLSANLQLSAAWVDTQLAATISVTGFIAGAGEIEAPRDVQSGWWVAVMPTAVALEKLAVPLT